METLPAKPLELEKPYEDLIGPLMPYCEAITLEYIRFRLPMRLLSGDANIELLKQLFRQIEMQNEIVDVPMSSDNLGYQERQLGVWKTVTLWWRKPITRKQGEYLWQKKLG